MKLKKYIDRNEIRELGYQIDCVTYEDHGHDYVQDSNLLPEVYATLEEACEEAERLALLAHGDPDYEYTSFRVGTNSDCFGPEAEFFCNP